MKNQIELNLVIFIGLVFVLSLFPFAYVDGAKFQSGVTINAPSPAGTCPDSNGDGINDSTGEPCSSTTGPTAGTCGLQIVDGVPINYGQLISSQDSAEQKVTLKNEGTSQTPAKIMIKAGDWISDAAGNPSISGPEVTKVGLAPNTDWSSKKSLSSNGWELGQLSGGQSIPVYFQFKAFVNSPSVSLHQDVTIDLLC